MVVIVVPVVGGKVIRQLTYASMLHEINDEFDGFCHFVPSSISPVVVIAALVIVAMQIL